MKGSKGERSSEMCRDGADTVLDSEVVRAPRPKDSRSRNEGCCEEAEGVWPKKRRTDAHSTVMEDGMAALAEGERVPSGFEGCGF